ncbi:hypothetical protein JCM11641_007735 [Rhodosporidiobolus odoratus]
MSGTASDEDCTGESRTAWLRPYRQRLLEDAAVCFSPDRVKLLQKAFYIIHSFSRHHPEEDERAWEAGDLLPFDHYMAKPKDAKGKEYRLHHWPPTVHELVAWDHDYDEDHHSQFEHWLTCVLFPEGPDDDHKERQFLNPRYKPNRLRSPEPLENLHLPEREGHELITQHELSNRLKAQPNWRKRPPRQRPELIVNQLTPVQDPSALFDAVRVAAQMARENLGIGGAKGVAVICLGKSRISLGADRWSILTRLELFSLTTDNPFGGGLPEPASSDAASFSPNGFKYAEDFELAWEQWKSRSKAAAEVDVATRDSLASPPSPATALWCLLPIQQQRLGVSTRR